MTDVLRRPDEKRPEWDDGPPAESRVVDRADRQASERARVSSQRGRRDAPQPRPPTADDKRDEDIRRACAGALINYMKRGIDLSRRFRSLKQQEAENIAQAVISEWVVQASRRVAAEPERNVDLKNILWG